MRKLLLLVMSMLTVGIMMGQVNTNASLLQKTQREAAAKEKNLQERIQKLSTQKGWPLTIRGKNGQISVLTDIDPLGLPVYVSTNSNILSASTIKTNSLWPGASTGLNLSGSSASVRSKLAVWDGGRVLGTHVELNGKILQKDNPADVSDHSTHVAGTMAANGINPYAKGMAHGLTQLLAYDFNSHMPEMAGEAPNILVSNHSYSTIAGWQFNVGSNRWEFYGQFGAREDYKFGYYSADAQLWDSIAYNAPYYLIVKAAGNNRSENGPAVGQPYFRFNASGQMTSAGNRPTGISNNDSYETLPTYSVSKNILTVGAINPISDGYARPEDVVMTDFSAWGPTDDGRIKPDVVADGVNVFSSVGTANNEYGIFSGTSMAAPAAAGSVLLLQEYYARLHAGAYLRSATLKGIVIHTADEAGPNPGPDYQHGWGLINMERAASVITSNNVDQLIIENTLAQGATFTQNVIASGKGPLVVTICWTDPKGDVDETNLLNNTARKLVHDLDIRVTRGATTYMPWKLDPVNRANAATTGDNILDNVEKITIPDAIPGQTYTITVSHKGTLARSQQAYSLIASGVGGAAYCASAATSNAGTRIDSVSISNILNKNPVGCTTYTSYTNLTIQAQPGQALPFYVGVNSCDASSANKIIKIFIDFNNDGDFTDAGENVATSNVIAGNGNFTGNINIPANVTIDNSTMMRIVAQETGTAANVNPCGNYANGETQDYRVRFVTPSKDAGIVEVVSPSPGVCASGAQYVTARIRNLGTVAQSNIPLLLTVKQGATTIVNLPFTYPLSIPPYATAEYTFQTPFQSTAGESYVISIRTNLAGDQNPSNDLKEETIQIDANSGAVPSPAAEICGTNAMFKASATGLDVPLWYATANATTPLAAGNSATSNTITGNLTYYVGLNDAVLKAGPANKLVLPNGSYNAFDGNFVRFNNTVPLIIETARLYIANAGKITFTVADIVSFNNQTGAYSYFPVSATTIDVYPTTPTPQAGDVPGNSAADTGAIYLLNLPVPEAGNHAIIVQCADGANIFRNNNIATNPYPIGVPNVFTFTGNSAIDTEPPIDANYYQRFYYFFYDVSLRLVNCPGPRVAVVATTATAPVISLNGNVFTSTKATGNQWYRNGGEIAGATNQTFSATQGGTYKVITTDDFGCALGSNELNFTPTDVIDVDGNPIALALSPNPNNGHFNLQFEVKQKRDLQIDMINVLGQKVYQSSQPGFIGKFSQEIRLNKLLPGIYYLKIQHGQEVYVKKVMVK